MKDKENVLRKKSYDFALQTVRALLQLQGEKKEYVLTKQLFRRATSVGANVEEANQAESKQDFIYKRIINYPLLISIERTAIQI